ncbi:hypothetical protein PVAND_011263 [Polypedilum vanderplanki]|uniref:Uncharacterized protein n=1 Tax=Polypedilum vanderplanki TaxID=319348 RepID=A0A9J6CIY0_POLVA|nr:hypothetical protein PVAND_011263 [Polypedilum vanderplanki]
MKFFIKLFTLLIILHVATLAPTSIEEEKKKDDDITVVVVDPCESEELNSLLYCAVDDNECEAKNEQITLKRQAICNKNFHCFYCNVSQPTEITNLESLFVEPEIVQTIRPPLETNNENIPIDETIVIDGSVEEIIDENQATSDPSKPLKLIERNIVVENDNETHYYRGYVDPSSNVTTIIRLTNLINNTNTIYMPTTLNNTNINNIHVFSNKSANSGGKFGLGYNEDGPCCYSMKPGLCKQTTAGLKCRHKKTRVCGRQCTKKMIHTQRSFCNQIPHWPYMICPQYAPQPPFYPPIQQFPPQIDDDFDDDDDLPLFPTDEELENEESDWVVHQEKCKIVSEDGLHISNCTEKNVDFEHPYARNSVDNAGKRNPRHTKNHHKKMQPQQQQFYTYNYPPMMQPVYYQPIPIYMAPIPQYYPMMPYFQPAPSPMNNYYPQQMPLPPIDTENYYDEPMIEIREVNPYKNSKKHSKKHPIVIEHDDEL